MLSGGHDNVIGEAKMLSRIKRSFFWHCMRLDCKCHVRSCAQYKGAKRQSRGQLGSFHSGAPMEWVHVDILGPLTLSRSGNLMVVEPFTKWVEEYAMPNQTAKTVVTSLVNSYSVSRFGCPRFIHTDQ